MVEQWPYDDWDWSQLREEVTQLAAENERLRALLQRVATGLGPRDDGQLGYTVHLDVTTGLDIIDMEADHAPV